MAASAINASSVSSNTSSDIDLAAGSTTTISLFAAASGALPRGCSASIQKKSSSGAYHEVAVISDRGPVSVVLEGPGVYRVVKAAGSTAFGVDQA